MKKLLALVLCLAMLLCFVGCGNTAKIVVAEKESAGESVAQEEADFEAYEYTAVDTQAKALMEVNALTMKTLLLKATVILKKNTVSLSERVLTLPQRLTKSSAN